jgi:hypothetical protein
VTLERPNPPPRRDCPAGAPEVAGCKSPVAGEIAGGGAGEERVFGELGVGEGSGGVLIAEVRMQIAEVNILTTDDPSASLRAGAGEHRLTPGTAKHYAEDTI